MSAQLHSTRPVPRAPWRDHFLQHIESTMKSPEFVLATLSSSASTGEPVPRARFCVYRGLWTRLRANEYNEVEKNPAGVVESDCVTFTTDVRMEKAGQIRASGSQGESQGDDGEAETGGGGPVEAVWWVNEQGVKTQWRVKGDAWVIGNDVEDDSKGSVKRVKQEVGNWMRTLDESKIGSWSWEREIEAHYGNLSPGMRGSFKHPPPGRSVADVPETDDFKLGGTAEPDDSLGRKNFRVVIIRPFEVESNDIKDPATSRRQRYTYDAEKNEWTHQELWP